MRKMKKRSRVSVAVTLCLAFVMTMLMSVSTFALSKTETQDVTVTNLKNGSTVNAYQVIKLNVNDQGGFSSPMYTWDTDIQSWVRGQYPSYIDAQGNVTDTFTALEDEDSKPFWNTLAKAVTTNTGLNLRPDETATSVSDDQAVLQDLEMGSYLLLADCGTDVGLVYQVTAYAVLPTESGSSYELAPEGTVALKFSEPPFEKTVPDIDDVTSAVGKSVNYQIHSQVPAYPSNADYAKYIIGDRMGTGLDFNMGTIVVSKDAAQAEKIEESADTYQLEETTGGFTLTFAKSFVLNNPRQELYVSYSATVNKDAVGVDVINNDSWLTYNRNPYEDEDYTVPSEEPVYTYDILFDKMDNTATNFLTGAKFKVQDGSDKYLKFTKTYNNTYVYDDKGSAGSVEELEVTTDGPLRILGLDTGVYKLTETQAPQDYVLPTGYVTITLVDAQGSETGPDGKLDAETKAEANGTYKIQDTETINSQTQFHFVLLNSKPGDLNLPVTGGMGTLIFTIAGIAVMGGAVMLFMYGRKKNSAK